MIETAALMAIAAILLMLFPPYRFELALAGWPGDQTPPPERKPWEDLVMFKKGGGGSSNPDPQIGAAALKEAQTGEEWLSFAREQFAEGNKRQDVTDALNEKVTNAQLESMNDSNARASEQWDLYKKNYQPVEEAYIKEATNWGSQDREDKLAAEAKADVMAGAASAKEQSLRTMASMGVNPNSGRFAGTERSGDLATALTAAGAGNAARDQVRTQALALKEGVANMGKGATSTSAQQLGLGLQSGNSAVGNNATATQLWQQNNQIMNQGFQGAMQGYHGQAGILNQSYGIQQQAKAQQNATNAANTSGMIQGVAAIGATAAMVF